MMQDHPQQTLLALVQQARLARKVVPGQQIKLDLEAAYRIQATLGEGQELRGYKLGLLSPAKQAQMGITTPIYGRIYAKMLLHSPVSLSQYIQPRFEPELAVILKQDIPPTASPVMALQAIEAAYLGIDLLDSIWEGYRFSIAEVVADNASGGGFLRGTQPLHLPIEGTLRLFVNDSPVAEGSLTALGSIEEHLAWLAHQVNGLAAGHIIYLGSPVAALPAIPATVTVHGPAGTQMTVVFEQ
jgi:2-oxo-3-hexenedioate decarboxylase